MWRMCALNRLFVHTLLLINQNLMHKSSKTCQTIRMLLYILGIINSGCLTFPLVAALESGLEPVRAKVMGMKGEDGVFRWCFCSFSNLHCCVLSLPSSALCPCFCVFYREKKRHAYCFPSLLHRASPVRPGDQTDLQLTHFSPETLTESRLQVLLSSKTHQCDVCRLNYSCASASGGGHICVRSEVK